MNWNSSLCRLLIWWVLALFWLLPPYLLPGPLRPRLRLPHAGVLLRVGAPAGLHTEPHGADWGAHQVGNSETVVLKGRPPSNLNISQERDDWAGAAVLWPGTLQRQREPRPGARLRQPRGERTGIRRIIEQCFAGSQQNCQVFAQVIQFRNSSSWRRSLQG